MEITGRITKAYSPKSYQGGGQADKFFFEIETEEETFKGMAPNDMLTDVVRGNVVTFETSKRGEWLRPKSVNVLERYVPPTEERTFHVGYIGKPKSGRYGWTSKTKLSDGTWVTIPCSVSSGYFGEPTEGKFDFPRGGHGTIDAKVALNGGMIVKKILNWTPDSKEVEFDVEFNRMRRMIGGLNLLGPDGWVRVPREAFPLEDDDFELVRMIEGYAHISYRALAYAESWKSVGWEVDRDSICVTLHGDVPDADIQDLLRTARVTRIANQVYAEVERLMSQDQMIDLDQVRNMFLEKGIEPTDNQIQAAYGAEYDGRFLSALMELVDSPKVWALTEGFLIKLNDWLIWERCRPAAATYILPARPNEAVTGPLNLNEWASVLARVLPWINKMDLRYGEAGQFLAGTHDGVKFAIHAKDGDDSIRGWIDTIKDIIQSEPEDEGAIPGLPSLTDVLSLAAENQS